jgi:non-heme chloroperoxidase
MPSFRTQDGTTLFYKEWGSGRPVVFSHGFPLSSDAWDLQMHALAEAGFRCIAHDRRGHGRSEQPGHGNDMNTYADDLAALVAHLDLREAVHVGHSTGGGEVVRYLGRHGTRRASKAVIISGIPPLMLRTPTNPKGTPIEVFDGLRAGLLRDRSGLFRELAAAFYGSNRPGHSVPEGLHHDFWRQGMQAGLRNEYECIRVFSETDLTADLGRIDIPTLFIHGDDDQIVPIAAAAERAVGLVRGATLKVYAGGGHGLCSTDAERINTDLIHFIRS